MPNIQASIEVEVFDAPLGAEILGLDLHHPLPARDFQRIDQAHLDRHLLVFRDQRVTPQQQVDFSRRFGLLQIHVPRNFQLPSNPEVLVISNIIENGQPIGLGDAGYSAPDLISQRAKVSTEISSALRTKLAVYDAQVINIDMTNFSFSDDYMKAIAEKVTQEQLRLGAENRLKTVEAEQKQKVAVVEASALEAKADGEAYASVKTATAQAEALRVQNDALARSKEVLELRRIEVGKIKAERWDGALPQNMYRNAPIPYLNLAK